MKVILENYTTPDLIESDFMIITTLRVSRNWKEFITLDTNRFLDDLGVFISPTGFHNIESEELHALVVDNDLGSSYMTLIRTNIVSKSVDILVDKTMVEYFDLLEYMRVVRTEIKKIIDGIG